MLDMFASSGELRTQVAEIYARWKAAGTALETLERTEQEKLRLLDLWEFQRREIEGAAPAAGEDEAIEAERRVLQNLGRGDRSRAPRPAEPRPLAGECRHRLRRALRFARSRAGAGAPGRHNAGRC